MQMETNFAYIDENYKRIVDAMEEAKAKYRKPTAFFRKIAVLKNLLIHLYHLERSMPMNALLTYRRLTEADVPTFVTMRITQLKEEGAQSDLDLEPALTAYYQKHLADGTFVSWLAVDGEKIVGTSGMSFVEKPPYYSNPTGKIGLLSSMYTNPTYRRQGIARKLLDHVVEEARTYGCGAVWITASEMGVLLYTAYGFEKNGRFLQYPLS